MIEKPNLKLIAFVGLAGSGKSSAVEYLAEHDYPKVAFQSAEQTTRQIHHLADAGQRIVVIDGLDSWSAYKQLKHEFPGELKVVAILTAAHLRHHRLENRSENPVHAAEAQQRDFHEIEQQHEGGVIAIADYFVTNDASPEAFFERVQATVQKIVG